MKSISPIFFSLVLFAISLTGCNNDTTDPGKTSSTDITEAALPKGKSVIEEDINNNNNNNTGTIPLGNNTSPDNNTNNTIPVLESKEGYLKKKFKNLLIFHAADTMVVNKPVLATLILSKNESIANLSVKVLEESNAKAADTAIITDTAIEFGTKMKAKLVAFGGSKADNSFEIEALGNDVQSFKTERKQIRWQWKVTPLKPGQQELKLYIQIIEKDDNEVNLPAKPIAVIILVKPESYLSQVGGFLHDQYQWIIGIAVAIITAMISGRARNKNYKLTQPHPPPPPQEKNVEA